MDMKGDSPRTLTDFVEKNHKLISILGVFAALAVLATRVPDFVKLSEPDSLVLKMIPFFLFTLAIRTFFEIVRNFKDFPYYGELFLFRSVFFLLMAGFVWIYVKAYYPLLAVLFFMFVVMIMLICALALFFFLVKASFKLSWFKGVNQKTKETLTPLVALGLFVSCCIVVSLLVQKH